ncbi:MAG: uncharacterized protein K0R36_579 [Chryseobacterium sp.]|jgi:hypothetical protein|nr:uncharacterized protein [Chryseobacterium sp.]
MPNRILRDWTDSFLIDDLDVNAERFFVRLIMKVDDYGRFYSDTRLLKSNLFPLKTDIRETDIARWLTACEKSGLITVYTIANKSYLQIKNFKQQLRQKTEKYPPPLEITKDDVNMHSRCIADDTLLHTRNEVETETEVEKKESVVVPTQTSKIKSFKVFTKDDFKNSIAENAKGFEKEMLNKFYQYWTEPSPSGKMRFQLEKTWETARRLNNWRSREKGILPAESSTMIKRKRL